MANVHLDVSVDKEACPLNLAPTASTTATLAVGDALAVALLDAHGFKEEDFARSHPGGALGRRLLTHVRDIMRSGEAIPAVTADTSLSAALLEITKKGMAMTAVVDQDFRAVGVFTDGDLRRLIEEVQDFGKLKIADVMHAIRAPSAPINWPSMPCISWKNFASTSCWWPMTAANWSARCISTT